jgi:hypothetical protein
VVVGVLKRRNQRSHRVLTHSPRLSSLASSRCPSAPRPATGIAAPRAPWRFVSTRTSIARSRSRRTMPQTASNNSMP